MVILDDLAASFSLTSSSSSSNTNELSGIGSSSSSANVDISSEMTVFETHPAPEPRLTNPDPKSVAFDAFFVPETNFPIGADDFVSDPPLPAFADSGDRLFPASLAETSAWSVEQICGVLAVAVIVPFILASNMLVIVSVARFKRLQMPTNYFIVSLAAVDIFVALVTPFVIVIEVLPGQVSDLLLCLAPNRILMTACGVSVLTLAAIAYDRHTALVSPLKYVSVMTIRKIGILVTLTWVYSAVIVWAPLPLGWFSWRLPGKPDPSGALQPCSFKLLHDSAHILFLSAIVGPACLAITVCYFRIFMVARHHARAIAAVENSVHHNLRIRFIIKDAKYAKTLALVIGVFLVLWTPYLACLLAQVLANVHVSPWVWNYLTLLAVLNSGLNPWIYAFKNNEFRTAFRKIFKTCCSVGSRSAACLRFGTESRRPSSLYDANTFATTTTTTTTTSMSQTRAGRLSRGSMTPVGRLSDVSCVLSVGGEGAEHGNKVFGLKSADNRSDHMVKAPFLATLNSDALFYSRASDADTGKSVSIPLSKDSKAFMTDLLSLYLHHSLISTRVDVESPADREDGDLSDRASVDHSDHTDESYHSDHTEHSYHSENTDHTHLSDNTEHSYHYSDNTEHTHHSDDMEHSYHRDTAEHIYHTDNTEHSYYSENTEHSYHTNNTEHSYHTDNTEHSYYSDNTEHSHHTDNTEHSYHTDNTAHSYHTDNTKHSHHTDNTEHSYHTNKTEHSYHSENMEHSYHTDNTDHSYHTDETEHSYHPDNMEHSYHTSNTEHSYHNDNTENSYHSVNTEHSYFSNNRDHCDHSDNTDHSYHSDNTEHSSHRNNTDHSGNTDYTYHSDNTDHHSNHSDNQSDQTSRCGHSRSDRSSDQGGHTIRCYQGDHGGRSDHSLDTLSTHVVSMYRHRTL